MFVGYKQMKQIYVEKFPNATKYQIGSLIGGYIYLRFFNPIIVAPYMINICNKPSKIHKRNLIYIAKILQTLSNGTEFGIKESFMIPCNSFIYNNRDILQDYFNEIINVHDFDLEMDQYLSLIKQENFISIEIKQIYMIHQLIYNNKDKFKNDLKFYNIITSLNKLPIEQLNVNNHEKINLNLIIKNKRMSTIIQADDSYGYIKDQLIDILLHIDQATTTTLTTINDIKQYLYQQATLDKKLHEILQIIDNPKKVYITWNKLISEIFTSTTNTSKSSNVTLEQVNQVLNTIQKHHQYLKERIELYQQYLSNIKTQEELKYKMKYQNKIKKKKKEKPRQVKDHIIMSHYDLLDLNIINRIEEDIHHKILKSLKYHFKKVDMDTILIDIKIKKLISASIYVEPIQVNASTLIRMLTYNKHEYRIDNVILNTENLLKFCKDYLGVGQGLIFESDQEEEEED